MDLCLIMCKILTSFFTVKNHENADAMSRRPSTEQVVEVNQELNTVVDVLKESQLADTQLRPIIKALQEGKSPQSNSAPGLRRAFVHDGLLCRKFRESSSTSATTQLVIPCDVKDVVLRQLHTKQVTWVHTEQWNL